MNVCVYCASSKSVDKVYFQAAEELGKLIGINNDTLIYGGAKVGLMGAVAVSAKAAGARVIGVIPASLDSKEISNDGADELIITKDLRERKSIMESRANGFIALPGGFGTMEEMLEIITLRQLSLHAKPIAIINTNDFYHSLLEQFDRLIKESFAWDDKESLYHITKTPKEALDYIRRESAV